MNWVKQVKKLKLEEKQKQKKDYIEIDEDLFQEIEEFESLYDADKDKKNRLAGMMMESRKKDKPERKQRFKLDVVKKGFGNYKKK